MKANEFVKKFGLDVAKHKVDELKIIESIGDKLSIEDNNLIRLVESHELVEKYGGLDLARKEAHKNCFVFNVKLLRAIADVASCQ